MKKRKSARVCVVKTFRFDPELMEDASRVVYLTQEGDKPKYDSLTNFVVVALNELIRKERREIEDQGVAWNSLKPLKQSKNEEE